MKPARLVLLLMILIAFVQLAVIGSMMWSHHQVMKHGEQLRLDLGVVYVSDLSNQSTVSVNPFINTIDRAAGAGEPFPEADLNKSVRAWLLFNTNEQGLSEPGLWSLEEPRGSSNYLEVQLRSMGRGYTEKLSITYPFAGYRLDDFTLSNELQREIEMQEEGSSARYARSYRAEAFVRIYNGRFAIESVHFDVFENERDAQSYSPPQPQPQP